MLKCQTLYKAMLKYLKTFQNQQYQSWKWHNYTQWADLSFRPLMIMQVIFIIIKLSIVADNLMLWIIFGVEILVHLILFLCLPKIIHKESQFLQFVPLILQESLSVLCYFVINESYLIFYTATCVIFQSMYSTILWKVIAIIIFLIQTILLADLSSQEGLYLTITLLFMQIARKELQQMQHFINLQALFLIIDSTPQAMCIAHKDKNWLLYSNKLFENLANKLESTNQSETDHSPEKGAAATNNFTKNQLTFLQNLQLDELNNNQNVVQFDFDDDDLYLDDQYKIKNVTYSKDKNSIQYSKAFTLEIPTVRPKNHVQFQKFFQAFKNPEDESIIQKTFTSDVTMRIEVNNPPQFHLQSAGKKSQHKKSNLQNKTQKQQNYMASSRKVSADCLLNSKEYRNSGHKQSLLDQEVNFFNKTKPVYVHKMKFLINVLENCNIFDNDDELQIYFIHEVNQILLRTKLKKLESIKKNLLRSISHELLTNLNAVYGFIKQSQDKLLKQESCHIQLEQALSYTKLQRYKIYDFFDYRDILEDSFQLKSDKFDINTVILECVDLFRNQIERKSLIINVELPKTSYIISGDRQRLCQVLLNLIGNSIRFTFKGGINIIVQKQEYIESMEGIDLHSANYQDSNLLEVQINDTGIGMTEDELSILRKKLHLTDEDEKVSKHSVGIGLGLSVSKQIIKLMSPIGQNYLSVESTKDEGTQFNFLLKYHDESIYASNFLQRSNNHTIPNVDAQSTQQVRVMNYNKCNNLQITEKQGQSEMQLDLVLNECNCKIILIVDDEDFNIQVLSHMVKQLGFDIDSAYNGKQAIEKVQNQLLKRCNQKFCIGYNCILMDINMPMMNGWETVQMIRQIENEIHLTRTIPVIAVTAFCSIKDQQKSINEGFNSVLIKPATKELLIDAFNRLNI
ncbi:unnamed protein product (macronuclear) [Paramecium tetraurelia]|uniref:Histidine kinase n=1 Tax=Paramecium tetraurelia TaxID=5888 RepID=A0D8B9_PARTE|nr:uncharacterized protein GSPATT00014253001 [Paramecium tetraurelia]CAK79286.1 unnamed protein product [Paramecium tetraurelia]|eukprot:XP_001446683.1 hypothetical protein (macronuclear) [Paramecium tetraurelia strain d4-2]